MTHFVHLLVMLYATASFASTESSPLILFGHNLTPTTYTLKQGSSTAGFYAVGYGITDHLMIATSPWIILDYNMPMLDLKYSYKLADGYQGSVEGFYFKTYEYGRNYYHMEAWMLRKGFSHRFNDHFAWHSVIAGTYFVNDARPFSLRLDPGNDHRYTLSIGSLMEVALTESLGLMQEFGVLGVNYYNSYFHWGTSLYYKWRTGYAQLGISQSSTVKKVGRDSAGREVFEFEHIWHPEVHLQFFFD